MASLLLPSFLCTSVLTGCGGSSKTEEIYIPVGTARNVEISLENNQVYTVAFDESAEPSVASMHVRGYVPADDTAAEIAFYWYTNRAGEEAFPCYLIMTDVKNVTKGTGTATCALSDPYFADPAVTDRPGTLTKFNK